ncbi:MAG: type II toxin-antitoxin system HicA family toxin [Dehalococcoidia bacterium]
MPRLPRITGREAQRAVERDGWRMLNQSGSHINLKHSTKLGLVTIPLHGNKTLKPGTLTDIIRGSGMTVDEFRAKL